MVGLGQAYDCPGPALLLSNGRDPAKCLSYSIPETFKENKSSIMQGRL